MIRNHLAHSFFFSILLFVCVLLCKPVDRVEGASRIASECIGKLYSETENGQAVTGVRINRDSKKLAYAYDVWQYSVSGGWEFQYANLYGRVFDSQKACFDANPYLNFLEAIGSENRTQIVTEKIKSNLKDCSCYMIETVTYKKGQELDRVYEYSTDSAADWGSPERSLMLAVDQERLLVTGGCSPEERCLEYNIRTGIFIGEGKEVELSAEGAEIYGIGEAYWNGSDRYMIRKLPTAVKPKDRNRYIFTGWYTSAEGGLKLSAGDCISRDTTLYAHWEAIPEKCEVTCRDILQTKESEMVLGSTTWQAEYGDMVYGSDAGADPQMGAYYTGREYIGCSDSRVQAEGTTVYRYFRNSPMTVTCIDVVNLGPDTGQHLGSTIWEADYTSVASGGSLGCERTVGAYYQGYRYMYSSTQRVGENGCTVYRYFSPIMYDIEFVANCQSGGYMSVLKNCYYGHSYQLTANSFINRHTLKLSLNAEDATCDTACQSVCLDFAGWSDSRQGGVLFSDGCTVNSLRDTEGTVKLYAVWSDKETVVDGQPKRLGYEFSGWSADKSAQSGKRQFSVRSDMTLYAIWQAAPVQYHVEYYKQKLNQSYELASRYDFSAKTGSVASVGEIREIYPGFWLDEESSRLQGEVKPDGTLILNAYFHRGEYTLHFDVNGGKVISGGEKLAPVTDLFEQTVVLPDTELERTGYLFGGWTTQPDERQAVCRAGGEYSIPNHDQTLYACWIPKTDTKYTLIPYYENINGIGYMQGEQIALEGTTDSSLEESLLLRYPAENIEDSISKLLGEGYRLLEKETLCRTRISPQGDTVFELYLLRKRYELPFVLEQAGKKEVIATQTAAYGQSYTMPQRLAELTDIFCYQTPSGTIYYPGDRVVISKAQTFYIRRSRQEVQGSGAVKASVQPPHTSAPLTESGTTASGSGMTADAQESRAPEQSLAPSGQPKPSDAGDNLPSSSQTPSPGTDGSEGSQTPVSETDGSSGSRTPGSGTDGSEGSQTPGSGADGSGGSSSSEAGSGQSGAENQSAGEVSVISTWVGADSSQIASKLAQSEGAAFLKKGSRVKKKGIWYQVLQASAAKRTVCVTGLAKERTVVNIPNRIQVEGYSYQVTQVKPGALSGKKKLKKLVLGKNIKSIGKNAFAENPRLKLLELHSKNLAKIGAGAWKGCAKGMKIKFGKECSKSCRQAVTKMHARMVS